MDENHKPIVGYKGRCVTCGFLCKYSHNNLPFSYFEVTYYDRNTGRVETHVPDRLQGNVPTELICYRRAANIGNEIFNCRVDVPRDQVVSDRDIVKTIIWKERDCPRWFEYSPGFSPSQHLQELRMIEFEQRREEFDLRLDRSNKIFQLWLTFALIIIAGFSFMAALIPAAFPDGWPWLMEFLHSNPVPPKPRPLDIPGGI